jgi:hypothetical protein
MKFGGGSYCNTGAVLVERFPWAAARVMERAIAIRSRGDEIPMEAFDICPLLLPPRSNAAEKVP